MPETPLRTRSERGAPVLRSEGEWEQEPEEHRDRALVRADHQIRIDVAVEVETAGHGKSKGLHRIVQILRVDHLRVSLQHSGTRAVVDVDGAATVRAAVGRADDEVTVTVTVDVPQRGQRQAETSAVTFAVSG